MAVKVGDKIKTSSSGYAIVESIENQRKISIRFIDTNYRCVVRGDNLVRGKVRDPYSKTVGGVGFIGEGKYKESNSKIYNAWAAMIMRCTKKSERFVNYKDCHVIDDWHNFQNFAAWADENQLYLSGTHIDKDLKILGNRIYSPETCLVVDRNVNMFLCDRNALRGEFMIGVSYDSKRGLFRSRCRNPITGSEVFIGRFNDEISAHLAWRKKKSLFSIELASIQKNEDVRLGLVRYSKAIDNFEIYKDGRSR